MTPAQATLKTLVQSRSLWFWHAVGLLIFVPAVLAPAVNEDLRNGTVIGALIYPLWSGVVYASLFKDVLTKPFAFVIPAHARAWRTSVTFIGLFVSVLCALMSLAIRTDPAGPAIVDAWQMFLSCLTVYAAGVLVAVALSNTAALPGFITLLTVITLDDGIARNFRLSAEDILLSNPVPVAVVCTIAVFAAWKWLGSPHLPRNLCNQPFLPLHSILNGRAQTAYATRRKYRRLRTTPGALIRRVESVVLTRMLRLPAHTTRKALWGTVYMLSGRTAPARVSYLIAAGLGLMALSTGLGFYHPERFHETVSGANLVLFLVCAISTEYQINPHAALLLNVSRACRFRSLVFAALIQFAVVATVSGLLCLFSAAVGEFVHELTIQDRTWVYRPMNPEMFLLFAPMLPFFYLSQVLFRHRSVPAIMVISVVSILTFAFAADRFLAAPAAAVLLLQVASWLPFVLLVRHVCLTWDLRLDGS
jgi:hypothetical protein